MMSCLGGPGPHPSGVRVHRGPGRGDVGHERRDPPERRPSSAGRTGRHVTDGRGGYEKRPVDGNRRSRDESGLRSTSARKTPREVGSVSREPRSAEEPGHRAPRVVPGRLGLGRTASFLLGCLGLVAHGRRRARRRAGRRRRAGPAVDVGTQRGAPIRPSAEAAFVETGVSAAGGTSKAVRRAGVSALSGDHHGNGPGREGGTCRTSRS